MEVVDVVVRCRNEMPFAARTLAALAAQRNPRARVLFIDCRSTDGSREAAEAAGAQIEDLEPSAYVPGRVLNMGMRHTRSPIVAFVNADAIPLSDDAVGRLCAPLEKGGDVVATYARQLARPDSDRLTKLDYARAFGDEVLEVRLGPFFSMAASAIRRDTWERLPFDEDLRYSEDVDWVRRASALGWRVGYVADARFEHSHVYDLRAHFKRRVGEGTADAAIHRLGRPSAVRDLARPLVGSLVRDARMGVVSPVSVATRAVQAAGYFAGRRRAARRR